MYSQKSATTSIDNLRVKLFHRTNDPPTHDSSTLYVMRSSYQAMLWITASVTCPTLLLPKISGWKLEGDMLQPRLMTLDPIPSVCTELLTCACETRCSSLPCTYRKLKLFCRAGCQCGQNCFNSQQESMMTMLVMRSPTTRCNYQGLMFFIVYV